uniref:Retrovirus-related Pol polyprotein n=1 Tax=Anoplophora glabripennis TaxID=217634 RepID=V5GP60_ANOGL
MFCIGHLLQFALPITTLIARFLLAYRSTEHTSTGKTPASLMFGREIRTRLQILREDSEVDQEIRNQKQECELAEVVKTRNQSKKFYRGRRREFEPGEDVMVRDYRNVNQKSWTEGKIEERIGRTTYLCKLPTGKVWKRHANQIQTHLTTENGSDRRDTGVIDNSYNENNLQRYNRCNNKDHSEYFVNLPLFADMQVPSLVNCDQTTSDVRKSSRVIKQPNRLHDFITGQEYEELEG